jgi:hypothetical protein
MRKRGLNNKGQFQISFGMIFSIILIVIFLFVAVYAIYSFLKLQCTWSSGAFIDSLKKQVNSVFASSGQNVKFEGSLKNCKVEYVCFFKADEKINGSYENIGKGFYQKKIENNLYFYPPEKANVLSVKIEHINMEAFASNPQCFKVDNGNVEMKLSKGTNEELVKVS